MIAEILACLIAASGPTADCRWQELPVADATTHLGCMLMAPAAVARWAEENPARRVMRWTCRPAGQRRA